MIARIHPLFFAAAPVLFLYAHNAAEAPVGVAAGALGIAVAGAAVVLALARLLLRDPDRAALAASLGVILFFAYGHVFDLLWDTKAFSHSRDLHRLIAVLALGLFAGGASFLGKTRRDLGGVSLAAGVFSLAMVAMSGVQFASALTGEASASEAKVPKRAPVVEEERADLPDIYYIVLDGYARNDTLRDVYGYDNSAFWEALRERGFFVAENSRSNYLMTHFSLAATLNLRYINDVIAKSPKRSDSKKPSYSLIQRNAAAKFLQARGYRYIHFCTVYGGTETSRIADELVRLRPAFLQNEFMSVLLRTTALRAGEPSLAELDRFLMSEVQRVPEREGPTFTFLHLLVPHNPYVFDRDGNERADVPLSLQFEEKTGGWAEKEPYVDQLVYVSKRALEIVDTLIRTSPNPPIIILQSDHGSASTYKEGDDWRDAFYPERSGILNAWYAPPEVRARLTDDMHSVNTFRTLFSALFGAETPPLAREIYASWYGRPNDIRDITARMDAYDGVARTPDASTAGDAPTAAP